MFLKPPARQPRYFLQSARLFEQMSGAGDDLQPRFCSHACLRLFVHADDYIIVATNDKKSWCRHQRQRVTREIGAPTARDNGGNIELPAAAISAAAAPVDAPK